MRKVKYRDFEGLKQAKVQAGITLVALVVTIVVLLILAGVTITYVFSDNGILSRAQTAASETDAATMLEEIQSKLLAIQLQNTGSWTYSNDDVKTVVAEVTGISVDDIDDRAETVTTTDGTTIEISSLWVDGTSSSGSVEKWYYADDGSITDGTTILAIGDYVDYASGTVSCTSTLLDVGATYLCSFSDYGGTWQVLGVDETTGQVLLLSSDSVGLLHLDGWPAYINFVDELNRICSLYASGNGASSGRCVTVEDINKITGYNPNNVGVFDRNQSDVGERYGEGCVYQYGNEVTFYWDGSDYPYYTGTDILGNTNLTVSHSSGFYWWDGSSKMYSSKSETADGGNMEKIATLTSNYYRYYVTTLTDSTSDVQVGISTDSSVYNMLFGGNYYCLASRYVYCTSDRVEYGMFAVGTSGVVAQVSGMPFQFSKLNANSDDFYVRAVITLDTTVTLTQTRSNNWSISM